jgi:hypothetical protein
MTESEKQLEALRYERARKRVKSLSGFYKHLAAYVAVNLFLIGVKYFTGDNPSEFWSFQTFSTAFFWGIGLAFHAFGVFYNQVFFGAGWEEKKIKEIIEREKRTKKTWE